jgi:hypothetical protein
MGLLIPPPCLFFFFHHPRVKPGGRRKGEKQGDVRVGKVTLW